MKLNKTLIFSLIYLFLLIFSGCVATVGPSIEVPKIPLTESNIPNSLTGTNIGVGSFKDIRTLDYNSTGQGLVTPEGDISRTVEIALGDHLKAAGAEVNFGANIIIKGEIREWQSSYEGSTTGSLNSSASLFIEVVNQPSGTRLFSGLFKGNRSSHFPIVTPADIQDSLGFAMSQCIEQILKDSGVQRALH